MQVAASTAGYIAVVRESLRTWFEENHVRIENWAKENNYQLYAGKEYIEKISDARIEMHYRSEYSVRDCVKHTCQTEEIDPTLDSEVAMSAAFAIQGKYLPLLVI